MSKYKIIVCILILINIIMGIYIMFFMKKTPIYTLQQYAEQMGYFDSYRDIKIIYFDNYNFLKEKYKGEIDTTYVLTTYTNLIETYFNKLYQDTKDMDKENIAEYYKKNLSEIQLNIGITEEENFEILVNLLKKYDITQKKYTSGKLVENSIIDKNTYITFLLEIYYEDITIKFNVYVSNKDNLEEPIIKFIPVKEEL